MMIARENSRIVQKKDTPKRKMKKLESEYGNEEMKNIMNWSKNKDSEDAQSDVVIDVRDKLTEKRLTKIQLNKRVGWTKSW